MSTILIVQAIDCRYLPIIENFFPGGNLEAFRFKAVSFNPHTIHAHRRSSVQVQTLPNLSTRIIPVEKNITLAEFMCVDPENFEWIASVEDIDPVEGRRLFELDQKNGFGHKKVGVFLENGRIIQAQAAAA